MTREAAVMEIFGELDDRLIAEAMPRYAVHTEAGAASWNILAGRSDRSAEVSEKDVRRYMIIRALGMAAAAALIVGAIVLFLKNWDKIAVSGDHDNTDKVTTSVTEASVVTTSDISAPDKSGEITSVTEDPVNTTSEIRIPGNDDPFGSITDTSMPEPFGEVNDAGSHDDFSSQWITRFSNINTHVRYAYGINNSERADEIIAGYEADNHAENVTPYQLDDNVNLYRFIKDYGLPGERVANALEASNDATEVRVEYGSVSADMIFTAEETDALVTGDRKRIAELFASEYSIVAGEKVFSPRWLYYHTVEDYESMGITRDMVSEKYRKYKELGLNDEAWRAFRDKLAVYIYSAPYYGHDRVIPFDYNGDMYTSDTYNLLTKYFYGKWETEDGKHSVILNSEKSPFNFDGYAYPCGISETAEAYIFPFINSGEGEAYVIFKSDPDILYVGSWNGFGPSGYDYMPDVVLISENEPGYMLTDKVMTLMSFGEMSVLGEYILKSNHSRAFVDFYDETISSGYTEGFTDGSGQVWVLNGSMILTGSPRYIINDSLSSVTVGIKYFKKEESDAYMEQYGTEPEGKYFALTFMRSDNGDWSVSYSPLEDDFTKMFEPEPVGWEKFPIPVNVELNCEWSDLDREVQTFLTGNGEAYDEFLALYLWGWGNWATEEGMARNITRAFSEDTKSGMLYEYYLQRSDSPYFKDADALIAWMKEHFSERCYDLLYGSMFRSHSYDGEFSPPRYIIEDGMLYRDGGVRNRCCDIDCTTAKVIEEDPDSGIIVYACIGAEGYVPENYSAFYGALTYEDGVMKYDSLPKIELFEYGGTEVGDVAGIWGDITP